MAAGTPGVERRASRSGGDLSKVDGAEAGAALRDSAGAGSGRGALAGGRTRLGVAGAVDDANATMAWAASDRGEHGGRRDARGFPRLARGPVSPGGRRGKRTRGKAGPGRGTENCRGQGERSPREPLRRPDES